MSIFDLFKSKKSHRTGTGIYKDGREISYDEKITDNHFVVLLKGSSDAVIDSARTTLSATGAMDVKIIDA